jgi:hypothetical protein
MKLNLIIAAIAPILDFLNITSKSKFEFVAQNKIQFYSKNLSEYQFTARAKIDFMAR